MSSENLPYPFDELMAVSPVERPLSFDKLRMVSLVEPFAKEGNSSLLQSLPTGRQGRQGGNRHCEPEGRRNLVLDGIASSLCSSQ
jgi:hypothetical protein